MGDSTEDIPRAKWMGDEEYAERLEVFRRAIGDTKHNRDLMESVSKYEIFTMDDYRKQRGNK